MIRSCILLFLHFFSQYIKQYRYENHSIFSNIEKVWISHIFSYRMMILCGVWDKVMQGSARRA
jgi:hypothetical protein